MLRTPLRRLRTVGLLEGVSYLVLLGIAMPLKYRAGFPEAVQVVGSLHGGLFVIFLLCVAEVTMRRPWWSFTFWLTALIASIVPFGTFWLDRWLKRIEETDAARRSLVGQKALEQPL